MKTKTLDDIFQKEIQQAIQSKAFLAKVIQRHFEKAGLVLTPEQMQAIESQLSSSDEENIEIEFSDEQAAYLSDRGIDLKHLDLDQISDDDFDIEMSRVVKEVARAVSEQLGSDLAAELSSARSDILRERNKELGEFQTYLHDVWGAALDALEAFTSLCVELTQDRFADGLPSMPKNKRQVLARLHARSCQVSYEICTLLRAGFSDGAHARWRTLHELVTIGEFLLNAPDEVSEMYMIHADVAMAKEAEEFQRRQHSFGYEPIADTDMAELIAAKEAARSKFGTDFLKEYGWATEYLKTHHNKKDNRTLFSDIESAVNNSNLRNYYKLANRNVHAGYWGEYSRLGSDPELAENILLAGPSHFGLAIPAYYTAYSLGLLTLELLLKDLTIETLIAARALSLLVIQLNELVNAADAQAERH